MRSLGLLLLVLAANAQERQAAKDWPVHVKFDVAEMGAEYLVHSVLWQGESLFLKDYLVVEVAFYPHRARLPFLLKQDDFTLRVNGKKQPLYPQLPAMVAEAAKHQYDIGPGGLDMSTPPVILGRGRTGPDGRPVPYPKPPRVPEQDDKSGVEKKPKLTPEEILTQASLYEGKLSEPVRGLLYFAFKAKPGSVKKVELVYSGGQAQVTIPLL
ncbi:MAG: hypothetical protein HY820_08060 [Acidobacteria bacterium]|nr:hypothetical protein [Acidobacteriota bacterium]